MRVKPGPGHVEGSRPDHAAIGLAKVDGLRVSAGIRDKAEEVSGAPLKQSLCEVVHKQERANRGDPFLFSQDGGRFQSWTHSREDVENIPPRCSTPWKATGSISMVPVAS